MTTKRPASASDIVERFGMSTRSNRGITGKPLPTYLMRLQARDDEILAMREQGKTWGEIADRFGIVASTAQTAAKRSMGRAEGPAAQDAVRPQPTNQALGTTKPSSE